MTDEDRAYMRRVIEDRIETSVRKVISEELDAKFEQFFEYGDDPKEMRRVKDGIRWAAEKRETSQETWKTATAEFIKFLVGAAAGALGYWLGFGHGVGK